MLSEGRTDIAIGAKAVNNAPDFSEGVSLVVLGCHFHFPFRFYALKRLLSDVAVSDLAGASCLETVLEQEFADVASRHHGIQIFDLHSPGRSDPGDLDSVREIGRAHV